MERLEERVLEFINLNESEEFKKADRIVKKHASALEYIKREFKRLELRELSAEDGDETKTLSFIIRTCMRVDLTALPMDIREMYLKESEVWWKNIQVKKKVPIVVVVDNIGKDVEVDYLVFVFAVFDELDGF
ncbi:hypothetical protein DFS34DRAFT_654819 [Phlyctochytrium arcticum]|nr:hypothetical protein DFS34DRAFT_654819 [Phlyctochytrium arcticum]